MLSEDERWELWNAHGVDEMSQKEADAFARAIESAVLEKLRGHEPVAYVGMSGLISKHGDMLDLPFGTKLFSHPAPVQQEQAHTDHPARHYDRTCAACQQDCNCADQTDCDGKCCKPVPAPAHTQPWTPEEREGIRQAFVKVFGWDEPPNLYSITGDIKDINTLLVPRKLK